MNYDIIIIGSGLYGSLLANEFLKENKKVLIIEAGKNKKIDFNEQNKFPLKFQKNKIKFIKKNNNLFYHYVFGGKSNYWYGHSNPPLKKYIKKNPFFYKIFKKYNKNVYSLLKLKKYHIPFLFNKNKNKYIYPSYISNEKKTSKPICLKKKLLKNKNCSILFSKKVLSIEKNKETIQINFQNKEKLNINNNIPIILALDTFNLINVLKKSNICLNKKLIGSTFFNHLRYQYIIRFPISEMNNKYFKEGYLMFNQDKNIYNQIQIIKKNKYFYMHLDYFIEPKYKYFKKKSFKILKINNLTFKIIRNKYKLCFKKLKKKDINQFKKVQKINLDLLKKLKKKNIEFFDFEKNSFLKNIPKLNIKQNYIYDSKHESGGIIFNKHIDKNLKIIGTNNLYIIGNSLLTSYFGTQPSFLTSCFILHLKNIILNTLKK